MKKLLPLLLAFRDFNALQSWGQNVKLSHPPANPSALRPPTAMSIRTLDLPTSDSGCIALKTSWFFGSQSSALDFPINMKF